MSFDAIAWAWKQELPCVQKMVLMALANCQNDDTLQCNPSFKYIATKAGVQRRTVIHHIQELADLGLIVVNPDERSNGSKTSNNYLLLLGGSATESLGVVQEMHQGSDLDAPLETVIKTVSSKPNDTSTSVPVSLEPPPVKRAGKKAPEVTDEFRERMLEKYQGDAQEIQNAISLALSHKNAKNYANTELYIQNWLNRGFKQTKGATNNGGLPIPRGLTPEDALNLQNKIIAENDERVRRNNSGGVEEERPSAGGRPRLQSEPVPDLQE